MTDKEQFASALYKNHASKMRKYINRYADDWELAKDLVNKTFSVLLVKLDVVIMHPHPVGWLYKTLQYIYKREVKRKYFTEVPLFEETIFSIYEAHYPQTPVNVESLLEILPTGLSKNDKQLLEWRYGEQYSYEEIAQWLGIKEDACRKRVSRAIIHCRELLNL